MFYTHVFLHVQYIYIQTHLHICIHIYIYTCTYVDTHICMTTTVRIYVYISDSQYLAHRLPNKKEQNPSLGLSRHRRLRGQPLLAVIPCCEAVTCRGLLTSGPPPAPPDGILFGASWPQLDCIWPWGMLKGAWRVPPSTSHRFFMGCRWPFSTGGPFDLTYMSQGPSSCSGDSIGVKVI